MVLIEVTVNVRGAVTMSFAVSPAVARLSAVSSAVLTVSFTAVGAVGSEMILRVIAGANEIDEAGMDALSP